MRYIATTILFSTCIMFLSLGLTGFISFDTENQASILKEELVESEVTVFQLDEFTFKFRLTNKISKEDMIIYQKRLNRGVKLAQSFELTKKYCKIVFKSGSTENEILQGITYAIRTFHFQTFKIITHE